MPSATKWLLESVPSQRTLTDDILPVDVRTTAWALFVIVRVQLTAFASVSVSASVVLSRTPTLPAKFGEMIVVEAARLPAVGAMWSSVYVSPTIGEVGKPALSRTRVRPVP